MKAIIESAHRQGIRSRSCSWLAGCCGGAVVMLVAGLANANPWAPLANFISPIPHVFIPDPSIVPGKDFSDIRDRDAAGIFDLEQVVAWDGLGGVRDSFDYSGSRPAPLNIDIGVDAIAAGGDALFQAVRDNEAALLFSVESDPNILFERETGLPASPPGFGVWATAVQLDAMNPPIDTDGLELWGDNNVDDSDRYSLADDPPLPGIGKVAIWSYTPPGGPSAPHTLTSDLAAAMDLQYFGIGGGGPLWSQLVELMDVDAIMTFGPRVTFSIRPLDLAPFDPLLPTFDGGEIWEYEDAMTPTKFLNHGGHLWDTAFDVRGTFLVNNENIDAIEAAAPEPTALAMLLLGLAPAWHFVRRRRDPQRITVDRQSQ
jgi:hypothetical protein